VCEVKQLCIYFSPHRYLHLMKVGDLIKEEMLPELMRWYIEATRPFEYDRLAYCRRSYGSVPKGIVKEYRHGVAKARHPASNRVRASAERSIQNNVEKHS
jgi:hypothetical protein